MKKTFFFNAITLMLTLNIALYSCSNDDDDNNDTPTNKELSYDFLGELTVGETDLFSLNSIAVNVSTIQNQDSLIFKIFHVKFAEAMPVTIDMSLFLGQDDFRITDSQIEAESDNIIPFAMNSFNSSYTITDFDGLVYDQRDSLKFSMMCRGLKVVYKGKNILK